MSLEVPVVQAVPQALGYPFFHLHHQVLCDQEIQAVRAALEYHPFLSGHVVLQHPSVPVVLADQVIHLRRLVLPVRASPSIR